MWPEEDGQHGLFYFLDHNCSCLFCRLPAVITAVDHAQSPGQRDASTLLRPGKVWAFGARVPTATVGGSEGMEKPFASVYRRVGVVSTYEGRRHAVHICFRRLRLPASPLSRSSR